ncbi:MAG: bifunctional riboflavin kinase/FAD synthetase [Clostridiaceae bacterium]|jgi:riboflavin kinase/FMN adenylyltransferase|nr:bifunctional riboflavin kinase/FAD synthetase [Clostridiaceae bacterium]
MNIYENEFDVADKKYCGVGLGNFDGLHRGHMTLINTLLSECHVHDLHSVIYTFKKHPEHILRKKLFTPLLMTMEHKAKVLEKTGLDSLFLQEFDEEFSRMTPESFIENILCKKLRAKLVVVGFNFRFGYMGKGDTVLLKKMGKKHGFKVIVIPPIKIGVEVVSSTSIRQYIMKGQMEKAFELLGKHFSIPGRVIPGKKIGRTMGFPTANMRPEDYLVMPACGVYITRTLYQEQWYDSVTNVGRCPTVADVDKITLETHMIGFTDELYGEDIEVFFLKKLRNERKFETREDLIRQIKLDIEKVKMYKKHL